MRASRGVRSVVGASEEWRVAADGAGDRDGRWKFECEVKEAGRGCVRLEEDGSAGYGGAVKGLGEVSGGVGGGSRELYIVGFWFQVSEKSEPRAHTKKTACRAPERLADLNRREFPRCANSVQNGVVEIRGVVTGEGVGNLRRYDYIRYCLRGSWADRIGLRYGSETGGDAGAGDR